MAAIRACPGVSSSGTLGDGDGDGDGECVAISSLANDESLSRKEYEKHQYTMSIMFIHLM